MSKFKENLKANPTVKVLQRCMPTITISPDALIKMQIYVENCSEEVGWLGTAYKDEDENNIHISDVFLFDQEVHSTTTEITPEGLSTFAETILEEADGMDIWNNLKVWGHSHVNMSVSPSSQDDNQMSTFADGGHDWFIRIIANKKGDIRVDFYSYELGVYFNDLPWSETVSQQEAEIQLHIAKLYNMLDEIEERRTKMYEDDIKEEIKEKVKKKSYQQTTTSYWDRHKNNATPTSGTNITPITTMGAGGSDKKKDETKNEKKASEIESERIESDIEVYQWFSYDDLLEIANCKDLDEVDDIMLEYGFYKIFDKAELKIIFDTAKDVYKYFCDLQ